MDDDHQPLTTNRETGITAIDQAIAANYRQLSAGQRAVIDHLLADVRYGAVVSALKLAEAVGVSESTVTRAAQALGFSGFPDLQRHLRERFVTPRDDAGGEIAAEVPLATRVMLDDAARIREMAEDLTPTEIATVADAMVAARRVMIIGERGSHGLVLMLGIGLRLILDDVRILTQTAGDLPDQVIGLDARDVVIGISFRRVDRLTVDVLTYARKKGALTIALTDHRSSAAARAATRTLIARIGSMRLMPSFAPGASLINALVEEVAMRSPVHASERLQEAEDLWETFGSWANE